MFDPGVRVLLRCFGVFGEFAFGPLMGLVSAG